MMKKQVVIEPGKIKFHDVPVPAVEENEVKIKIYRNIIIKTLI